MKHLRVFIATHSLAFSSFAHMVCPLLEHWTGTTLDGWTDQLCSAFLTWQPLEHSRDSTNKSSVFCQLLLALNYTKLVLYLPVIEPSFKFMVPLGRSLCVQYMGNDLLWVSECSIIRSSERSQFRLPLTKLLTGLSLWRIVETFTRYQMSVRFFACCDLEVHLSVF